MSNIINVTRPSPVMATDVGLNRSWVKERVVNTANDVTANKSASVSLLDKVQEETKEPGLSADSLKSAVEQGNELFQTVQRNLQFEIDDSTKEVVVKVVDKATGEVVRQIPSEEVLKLLKQMQEQQGGSGALLKSRV